MNRITAESRPHFKLTDSAARRVEAFPTIIRKSAQGTLGRGPWKNRAKLCAIESSVDVDVYAGIDVWLSLRVGDENIFRVVGDARTKGNACVRNRPIGGLRFAPAKQGKEHDDDSECDDPPNQKLETR